MEKFFEEAFIKLSTERKNNKLINDNSTRILENSIQTGSVSSNYIQTQNLEYKGNPIDLTSIQTKVPTRYLANITVLDSASIEINYENNFLGYDVSYEYEDVGKYVLRNESGLFTPNLYGFANNGTQHSIMTFDYVDTNTIMIYSYDIEGRLANNVNRVSFTLEFL